MKRARVILLVAIGLAAISALVWLLLFWSPSPQSYESAKTRLLFQVAKGSRYFGLHKTSRYFYSKGNDSRSWDLYTAVNVTRLVKIVRFEEQHADLRAYQGIASSLMKWASSNGVQIPSHGVSWNGLVIYVRASDEFKVTNYLSSLTTNERMN